MSGTIERGDRQPQQAGGPAAQIARHRARRRQRLIGGLRLRGEPLACFRHADAARRANEQRDTEARLQGAHRLARRRGGHLGGITYFRLR
jgi:hypothetical protein